MINNNNSNPDNFYEVVNNILFEKQIGFFPDSDSAMEVFVKNIRPGDTPSTSEYASALYDWLNETYIARVYYEQQHQLYQALYS